MAQVNWSLTQPVAIKSISIGHSWLVPASGGKSTKKLYLTKSIAT